MIKHFLAKVIRTIENGMVLVEQEGRLRKLYWHQFRRCKVGTQDKDLINNLENTLSCRWTEYSNEPKAEIQEEKPRR